MGRSVSGLYEFTIILADVEDLTEWVIRELDRGGCGDGMPWSREGIVGIHFHREASSAEEAIALATQDIERSGFGGERIGVDEIVA